MKRRLLGAMLAGFCAAGAVSGAEGVSIHTLDEPVFRAPKEKGRLEQVPGRLGQAARFTVDADARSLFFTSPLRGRPEWDQAAGFSFWVKGDGSDGFGGLQLIYDEDYAVRYDYTFPLKSTEWTKVKVAWRDLVPVLPGPRAKPLDPASGNRPSRISGVWLGKWWYWGDYPAYSFAVDDLRLEPEIPLDRSDYRPAGDPLGRVRAKLRAGRPITLVTMGDSLTDLRHWTNRQTSWPGFLEKRVGEAFRSEVTLVNPAIGGTQLRQNLVLIPRWLTKTPTPDLVTLCFGANDWEAGMRGEEFYEAYRDAVDRVRRATGGKSDVLILTTVPSAAKWTVMAELAKACRRAARDRNAGLADTEAAFLKAGEADREQLFVSDRVHLSPVGQELVAETVLQALHTGK